jgi:arylsulfatase A-like enzyme
MDGPFSESPASAVSRRDFLTQSSAAGALSLTSAANAAEITQSPDHARHNVILVISDQFRWDCMGRNELNSLNLTPNLDAMAAEGVNFINAITNQPVCAPSRACLFTSQYTNRHGVWRNSVALPQQATTLATVFREAGYSANYIGKWHLGLSGVPGPVAPEYRGGFSD